MALLIGTREGVFRSADATFDAVEQVLDSGNTLRVRTFEESVFAASKTGLYRSEDGMTWTNLDVPREEVFSVVVNPDGERLYAGTHPAHLYVSTDDGETWSECEGFQDLPSREEWHTPRHRNEAHIRSLGVHPDEPARVIAGVEVGGIHVSEDNGETWSERSDGLQNDVHHVLVLAADEYIASCGGGLYRTRDSGESWTRLDSEIEHRYFREAFAADERMYAAAARGPPGTWRGENGADAALFESPDSGETLERVLYPGAPDEFVLAWTAFEGRVLAGTTDGRVIARESDGWQTVGSVPTQIRSLAAI
ncbi:MAG TPA: glycosyl hydrolase [Halococcus sp.]|nr:glycosyl hydrolase [Halococcus sp.]